MIPGQTKVSGASFRDPSGYIVERDGEFLRVVQPGYAENYKCLFESGLYRALTEAGLVIPHEEIAADGLEGAFKVLRPRQVNFISYPYEWCFSQWQDAAHATLAIQKMALAHGMSLKDASAYNIQFVEGRPVLIDTLSFEKLVLRPWIAYGQFCRHFLAPLALISCRDPRLGQLAKIHLDGVPLALASKLLPWSSRLRFWLLIHLHLHAASEGKRGHVKPKTGGQPGYRLESLQGLVASLESAINGLKWSPPKTVWADYYDCTVTGGGYVEDKKKIVAAFLKIAPPRTVWDLGANTGLFSRIAAAGGAEVMAFDGDPDCVEINYLEGRKRKETRVLPLVLDLANPSPALGWAHRERMSWLERTKPDLVLALGLVHHLAMANNLPLGRIVDLFRELSPWLIIEFVPKDDPNAQKLLTVREDIFPEYTKENFEREFGRDFIIEQSQQVVDSNRVVYLLRRR